MTTLPDATDRDPKRGTPPAAPPPRGGRRHPSFVLRVMLAWLAAFMAPVGVANEYRTTLTLGADGSCVIRTESVQARSTIEQQVRLQERMKKLQESDEDDGVPTPPPAGTETKPFSDEEIAEKFRAISEEQMFQMGEAKIASLDVTSNTVRLVTTQSFPALDEMLRNPHVLWGQSGLTFEGVRVEPAGAEALRITLTPHSGNVRWMKNAKQRWKASKVKAELRLVLPGKVRTSGLPQTEGNATWIVIDAMKDETLAVAAKLYDGPVVITAESGGLKLDAPLDSKTLQRQPGRHGGGEPELPITDAGPGFIAEPMHVIVTTLHWFPDGPKHLKNAASAFGHQATGAVVQAKLYAPKGRTFQFLTGVRVLHAVDDKGRPLVAATAGENAPESSAYAPGGRGQANSMQILLHLPLPAADAQSIEHLDAEAIALTAGHWQEMTLPDVSATGTNEVDLASVLPGARLTITQVTAKNRQTRIQAQLKGPPAIRQIEIQSKTGGQRNANYSMNERGYKVNGAESTRTFTLQGYKMSDDGEQVSGALSLVVRHPEDQKRERVKFSLTGLDLF